MKANGNLWSQSGAFWAGCIGVAEGVLLTLLWLFVEPQPEKLDYVLARPWLIVAFLFASAILVVIVGWAAHRIGWGE